MSRKAVSILVSDRVKKLLVTEMNKRQLAGHYKKRMDIIHQSSLGFYNQDIGLSLGCSVVTVRKWRSKWHEFQDVILKLERGYDGKQVSDTLLLREIKAILSDAPRSGSSSRLSESEKKRLESLACEAPEKYDLPFTNWTHVELSKQAKKMGIEISPSYYGKLLKKQVTSP